MDIENLLAAINQLRAIAARLEGRESGDIAHSLRSLEVALQAQQQGQVVRLEEVVRIQIGGATDQLRRDQETGTLQIVNAVGEAVQTLERKIDVSIRGVAESIEGKTSEAFSNISRELFVETDQIRRSIIENAVRGRTTPVDMTNVELGPRQLKALEARLQTQAQEMLNDAFQPSFIQEGLERLRFRDSLGRVFEPAIEWVFGPDGPIAKVALREASHSPDFRPAMEVLFGASGKVADAAKDAASAANLDPALQPFEQKVEDGVKTALDKAGDDAKAHAASALASKAGEGARALGNVFTSLPQMVDSVKQLGEVWDQPLDSVESYMKLFGALGNTINQGVQTIEALAGVTKIATAAQAIFNAVMAMNPVVLIVLAVIALIAVIALLIVYWDQVKAALRDNPWIAVAAVMFGLIGIIVVIIAYWDEIKLAVLIAANFISIQLQKIGLFFIGLGTLIGMVWDFIVATGKNVGIAIINAFIIAGTKIQNLFIGVINTVLSAYNAIADSVIGSVLGLDKAELIPEVDVKTRLLEPEKVPTVSLDAAFKPMDNVKGGLEGQIAEQRGVVAAGERADAERRAREATGQPPAPPAGAPAGLPTLPPGAGVPGPGGLPQRPALPAGAGVSMPAGAAGGGVRVEGGIVININAEKMELDAARVLTDEIVQQLKAKLDALQATASFRTGVRTA